MKSIEPNWTPTEDQIRSTREVLEWVRQQRMNEIQTWMNPRRQTPEHVSAESSICNASLEKADVLVVNAWKRHQT